MGQKFEDQIQIILLDKLNTCYASGIHPFIQLPHSVLYFFPCVSVAVKTQILILVARDWQ